jgi:DNA-binding XRE family transcriptional regulator
MSFSPWTGFWEMPAGRSAGRIGAIRRVEMIREFLGLTPAEFAREIGLSPQSYTRMLRKGVVPEVVRLAAQGVAADRDAHVDHAFLVRLVDGIPSIVMLHDLRTTTVDGRLYLLLPLAPAEGQVELPPSHPVPALAGGGSRHQQIIDRVLVLLHEKNPRRPVEVLGELEGEGTWFAGSSSHHERLQELTGILWQEAHRADRRVHSPRRGWYALAQAVPTPKECLR